MKPLLVLFFSTCAIVLHAGTYDIPGTFDGLTYEIEGNTIVVTDCDNLVYGSFAIPETIEGLPVVTIAEEAFRGCTNLTSVEIPSQVTTIETRAFRSCTSLESIVFGASLVALGEDIFFDCESIEQFQVDPNNPELASLDGVLFDKSMTTLINYPRAKDGEYIIPNGVEIISNEAFDNRFSLDRVTIPSSVTNIGLGAFSACGNLQAIDVAPENAFYASIDGVLYNKLVTDLITYPGGKGSNFDVPDTVSSIRDDAFRFNSSLTLITLPRNLTSIGDRAFMWCFELKSIDIPASVVEIGQRAFYECDSLQSVTIGSGVTTIGSEAFHSWESLVTIIFNGNSPSNMGWNVFDNYFEDITIYFHENSTGFTTPYWQGVKSVALTELGDHDSDQFSNQIERLLGTSPVDPNDHFRTWIENEHGVLRLHHSPGADQVNLIIEYTSDLEDEHSWDEFFEAEFTGDSKERSTGLPPRETKQFFRIRIEEPEAIN
jgi:hypothetical protein